MENLLFSKPVYRRWSFRARLYSIKNICHIAQGSRSRFQLSNHFHKPNVCRKPPCIISQPLFLHHNMRLFSSSPQRRQRCNTPITYFSASCIFSKHDTAVNRFFREELHVSKIIQLINFIQQNPTELTPCINLIKLVRHNIAKLSLRS